MTGGVWVTEASAAGMRVTKKCHLCRFDHTPVRASIAIAVGPMMWLALMKIKAFGAHTQHLSGTAVASWIGDRVWPETTGRLTCVLRSAWHSRSADLRCLP